MRFAVATFALLALAACSQEPAAKQESADDFASRIGQQEGAVAADSENPNTVAESVPSGANLTQLQRLGDIGGVNLGPRDGGCTFMVENQELIIASGMNEDLPGKAVVRLGDALVVTDSGPDGLAAIKAGTTFTGEGFTIQIMPAEGAAQSRPANVVVSDVGGNSQTYSGNWICA
ncbi:hypothetical protein [Erythrobacter sp. SD-21]|uniref:hypothetical protein n=1 Tax=Erythrobacter sp. SD-21 TaxID=161528 RepID=UPI000153EF2F|nr:hypothetical protein [Erythrobacter sp. SD-21]EDL50389.1 hypothetical protein ED21_27998 [Erythrobacter sp. SD-21]